MADAEQTYREVMTKEPPAASTPFEVATREWRRAGCRHSLGSAARDAGPHLGAIEVNTTRRLEADR